MRFTSLLAVTALLFVFQASELLHDHAPGHSEPDCPGCIASASPAATEQVTLEPTPAGPTYHERVPSFTEPPLLTAPLRVAPKTSPPLA